MEMSHGRKEPRERERERGKGNGRERKEKRKDKFETRLRSLQTTRGKRHSFLKYIDMKLERTKGVTRTGLRLPQSSFFLAPPLFFVCTRRERERERERKFKTCELQKPKGERKRRSKRASQESKSDIFM